MESVTLEPITEEPKNTEFHTVSLEPLEREKSSSRQQFMLQKKNEIELQLTHYTKVKNRWARADATIKIVGTSVVVISSILSSVFSAGIAAPIVAATLSGIAALQTGLTEGIMISFTTKRKKFYRNKCAIIREFSNKLYFLYEKCREDNIITLDEMEQFYRLINEYSPSLIIDKAPAILPTLTKKIEPLTI